MYVLGRPAGAALLRLGVRRLARLLRCPLRSTAGRQHGAEGRARRDDRPPLWIHEAYRKRSHDSHDRIGKRAWGGGLLSYLREKRSAVDTGGRPLPIWPVAHSDEPRTDPVLASYRARGINDQTEGPSEARTNERAQLRGSFRAKTNIERASAAKRVFPSEDFHRTSERRNLRGSE